MRVNWRRIVGPRIRVPAGTRVRSMHPQDHGNIVTKRTVEVIAQPVHEYTDMVSWAGAGGYWKDALKTDVVFLEPPDTRRVVEPGEDPTSGALVYP